MISCMNRYFETSLETVVALHLYSKVTVSYKQNASQLHRSALKITMVLVIFSPFFAKHSQRELHSNAFKVLHTSPLLFMVDPVRSLSSASYRKSGSMSNGWNCQYWWNPLKATIDTGEQEAAGTSNFNGSGLGGTEIRNKAKGVQQLRRKNWNWNKKV